MKNLPIRQAMGFAIALLITSCSTEKAPLPELTYFGEEPRVQNPLSPEESQQHIQLPNGFSANLFAAEPNIINPIAFTWDEKGRLWVVQSQDYPHNLANDVGGDRITICEDTDGDGKADSFTDFATEQSLSTGIVIVKGGALVAQAPEIVFLEDTDGDDKMDKRTVLFDGFGTWDTHAGPANLKYGYDNQIWGSVGYSGFENEFNGELVNFTRGVYRFDRNGQSFEPLGQFNNNTWGLGITQDFEIFGSTANNNHCCYVGIPLRHYDYLNTLPSWAINADFIQGHYEISPATKIPLQQVDVRGGFTAAAGANFYTATNYPEEYRNQMYVNEPTGHLVHIARIADDGAGYKELEDGNIFASTDAWTAPVYSETGPDGNLWVADWYNPVIQHNPDKRGMENQIWNADKGEGNAHLNPLRDKKHGRIYIIKYKGKTDTKIKSLDPTDSKGLLKGLASSNMFWRTTAQRLIVENQVTELIPELGQLALKDSPAASHALWSLAGLGVIEEGIPEAEDVLKNALTAKTEGLVRTALALIPETTHGTALLLASDLLQHKNLHLRLAAILRASELPETEAMAAAIKEIQDDPANQNDKWLSAALKIYTREPNLEKVNPENVVMVIPSAEEEPASWSYTTSDPGANWYAADFDASSWEEGTSVFGTADLNDNIRTTWSTSDIWLRREVTVEEGFKKPVLKVLHDEKYEIYVNGSLFFANTGWGRKYKYIGIDEDKAALFKPGKNLIAVYCHNESGNQYIDMGIGRIGEIAVDRQLNLKTVSQEMAYDQKVLHAMAGEQLEISLENIDEMPHNLVLIESGSLNAFGKLVDKFLETPTAAEMEYVPESRYVLGATKMLNPGEKGTIRLKVPDKAGDYPFICTFPGHWRMMQGVLKVSPRGSYVSPNPTALHIAAMGGGSSHEFLKFFGVADGKVMHQNGANTFSYTENSTQLEKLLDQADLLVISNNKAFEASTKEAIFDRVNQGMPMMIYHPSVWYNWKDWPAYNRDLVSGGSRSHEKLQEFEVRVTKPNHPIMKGVPATFRITDELYRWEEDPAGPGVEVLAVGRGLESGKEYPVVWTVRHPKAKIVGNTLGHDEDAHGLAPYQTILNNSLNWLKQGIKERLAN
ncbi:MAG: ThuA domain-containing protein [Saprospiraceae bacterium]|nr:ThuA domain-containing protein [Saprospiraceae bacterium]